MSATAAPGLAAVLRYAAHQRRNSGIGGHGRRAFLESDGAAPLLADLLEEFLALRLGGSIGITGVADTFRVGADHDESRGAFGISGGEEGSHGAAFGDAAEGGAPGADGVHHRPDVVHALLERGQAIEWYAIGQSRAAFVEEDEARERREAAQESGERRLGPEILEMRDPAHDEDQVQRSITENLVGDVDVATTGVVGWWNSGFGRAGGRGLLGRGDKAVAAAMGGLDEARFFAGVRQDSADFSDCNFQDVGADVDVGPNSLEQFLFADQLAGSFGKVSKDTKCLRREVERLGAARKATCRQIELKRWKGNTFASGC